MTNEVWTDDADSARDALALLGAALNADVAGVEAVLDRADTRALALELAFITAGLVSEQGRAAEWFADAHRRIDHSVLTVNDGLLRDENGDIFVEGSHGPLGLVTERAGLDGGVR